MNAQHAAEAIVRDHPAVAREVFRLLNSGKRKAGLTPRMRELLDFIEAYHDRKQIMPSYDEMKDALGLASKSGIHRLIDSLEERGYLRRQPKARSIQLVA